MARSDQNSRWTPQRKAHLIERVRSGVLTRAEAETLHGITAEEFAQWERDFDVAGVNGLHVRIQGHRDRRRAERLAGAPLDPQGEAA